MSPDPGAPLTQPRWSCRDVYRLMSSSVCPNSPSEKYDTAIRIWKALEHRARNLAQPRIDILPEMHLALLRVHVATSHDVDLPTVAREMARYKVNETEDFLIMKARCAAQIGDVQATNKLTERLVKEHGYHPQDSKLTSPTLTVRQLRHHFGPFPTHFSAICRPSRAVQCALLSGHACRMLTAWKPMLCPLHHFRPT